MINSLHASELTHPGLQRETNEDATYIRFVSQSGQPPTGLFIVADGMGGHQAGEVASRLAIEKVASALASLFSPPPDPKQTRQLKATTDMHPLAETGIEADLQQAVQDANQVIIRYGQRHSESAGDLGSTITAMVVHQGSAFIANVGDSRTYRFRRGELMQITRDHSLVASLVAAGQLEPEELYTHDRRSQIYRCLGASPNLVVDIFPVAMEVGDIFLLCSDGLWEMVRDPAIGDVLGSGTSPQTICQQLVELANANGGADNISVIVVQVA